MINIYTGPAIAQVMAGHALNHNAQVLREDHVPLWREGGLTGAVLQVSDFNTVGMLLSEIHRSDGELALVTSRSEFEALPAETFGIFLSVEGYVSLAGDFHALHVLSELGVTAFTFSHNVQNALCTGCNDRAGEGGFTHLGKATLKELESLPMMVDLVHMSRASFWDALDLYSGDVFVSHANTHTVCPHVRNLDDDQIRAVAERNGVIGVTSYRGYVADDPWSASLEHVLDHAMHIYDLVGPEHLAVGADYIGVPSEMIAHALVAADPDDTYGLNSSGADIYAVGPAGWEDASTIDTLVTGLADRGLTPKELELVTGGNYLAMLERTRPSVGHTLS